jgi:hypothetical protein
MVIEDRFEVRGAKLPDDAKAVAYRAYEPVSRPFELTVEFSTEDADFDAEACLKSQLSLVVRAAVPSAQENAQEKQTAKNSSREAEGDEERSSEPPRVGGRGRKTRAMEQEMGAGRRACWEPTDFGTRSRKPSRNVQRWNGKLSCPCGVNGRDGGGRGASPSRASSSPAASRWVAALTQRIGPEQRGQVSRSATNVRRSSSAQGL